MRFIGSKVSLLENIQAVIDENVKDDAHIFCDIFAGTNSVAQYFKLDIKLLLMIYYTFLMLYQKDSYKK
jgi:adenine-specific DNA-methyltransferase